MPLRSAWHRGPGDVGNEEGAQKFVGADLLRNASGGIGWLSNVSGGVDLVWGIGSRCGIICEILCGIVCGWNGGDCVGMCDHVCIRFWVITWVIIAGSW